MNPASSTSGGRLPGLDGWRALAIALVLLGHGAFNERLAEGGWAQFIQRHLPTGGDGVRLFFCLSGFLITHLLLREESRWGGISLGRFYIRRLLRIWPVYYTYVGCIALLNLWQHWGLTWQNFITPASFTTGFWLRRHNTWVFEHFWSLAVEEAFYLFWPFVLARLSKPSRWGVAMALLAGLPVVRLCAIGTRGEYLFGFGVVMNLDYLMMGCAGALAFDRCSVWLSRRPVWVAHSFQVGGLALFWLVQWPLAAGREWGLSGAFLQRLEAGPGPSLMALGLTVTIAATACSPGLLLTRLLELAPLAMLGRISYSVYIWQQVVINPHAAAPVWWQRFPVNCLVAVLAGWLSYHLLEKWFLRLKERFGARPASCCADDAAAPPANQP